MACVFPGAPDLDTYWHNIQAGVDAITDVPEGRWDPVFYDPGSTAPDRFYCRRGGFVDAYATFDPLRFGIMPAAAQGAEPDQLVALEVAAQALADAGYDSRPFPRDRTGVILGRGGYIGPGLTRLEQHVRGAQQLVESLRSLLPELEEERLAAVKAEFQAHLSVYGPDTAIGLVPNLAASRIANRLDLGGPAYTVDAACASALVSVGQACRDLLDGATDLGLAGGIHLANDEAFWSVFCQLGALSREQQIRPFDRRADGLLIGEGIGMVVLKRLADAERDGDRVYAIVRGVGVASDGRGTSLLTPAPAGQLLALKRAWETAGVEPATIGLLEAHGTATPAGDTAELETIAEFFGPANGDRGRAGLGSVKSMIGHAMPAAGAAGLIKTALAVYHGVLPPTLHCEQPRPEVERTRFRLLHETEPWEGLRRAGVNAFGFGGINAHVVVEAAGAEPAPRRRPPAEPVEDVLVLAAGSQAELLEALAGGENAGAGSWRLAVVDPTPERLGQARAAVESGRPRRGRDGIYFSPEGLVTQGGKVAFVFPGVEAELRPRVADVAAHFRLPEPGSIARDDIEGRGIAVYEVSRLLHAALGEIGVRPDLIAGHSLGEWSGMVAAGMLPAQAVDALIAELTPGSLALPGFVFAAAGCGVDRALAAIDGLETVSISHDNCPHQTVLCGLQEEIEVAMRRLREGRVLAQVVPYPKGGFHTPLFAPNAEPLRRHFADQPISPGRIPLWSTTTCAPYPSDPDRIRELAVRHLLEPVRFRELLLALHEDGVRVFVQVGAGNLVGFADDTLRGISHLAIASNLPQRSGLAQLRRAAAALFVEGVDVRLERLDLGLRPAPRPLRLALGVPLVRLRHRLSDDLAAPPAPAGDDPVLRELELMLSELRDAGEAVARAAATTAPPSAALPGGAATARDLVEPITFGLEPYPELSDHCLFPQPPGWPDPADGCPVVPMTMSLEVFRDAAARISGLVPTALERIRAVKWLVAAPETEAVVRASYDGLDRVETAIEGFGEGVVRVAGSLPPAPEPLPPSLTNERRPPVTTGAQLYRDRWMFHGPAYQGIVSIDALGDDGIRGVIEALPAPGALLDAAGQLFGYWTMVTQDVDKLSMPVLIDRVELYEEPVAGQRFDCLVRIRQVSAHAVTADLELVREGRVSARVTGWQDWRFETDERLWNVIRYPERNLLAEPLEGGCVIVDGSARSSRTQEYLSRRFLSAGELAELARRPRAQQADWLYGRIAAKDAVRRLLFDAGLRELFPIELSVRSGDDGRPLVSGEFEQDVRVSIAHKNGVAVALAAIGEDPGVDIESIEPREASFERLAFFADELELLPETDRDEWLTRLWAAKEAAAKALGTGFTGFPRGLAATAVDGERFTVRNRSVETRRRGVTIIAWTPA